MANVDEMSGNEELKRRRREGMSIQVGDGYTSAKTTPII